MVTKKEAKRIIKIIQEQFQFLNSIDVKFDLIEEVPNPLAIAIRGKTGTTQLSLIEKNNERKDISTDYKVEITLNLLTFITGKLAEKSLEFRWADYLSGFGLELKRDGKACFVLGVLHELGHLDMLYFMNKVLDVPMYDIEPFITLTDRSIELMFPKDKRLDLEVDKSLAVKYHLSTNELYADNFMYKYFPMIWMKVMNDKKYTITDRGVF